MACDIMQHEFFKKKVILTSLPSSALHTDPKLVEHDRPIVKLSSSSLMPTSNQLLPHSRTKSLSRAYMISTTSATECSTTRRGQG
jgi:hypothetical protein